MGTVLVVDFGSQYTHLIARRIRQLNVYSEVRESSVRPEEVTADAVILSGGPASVYDANAPRNDALINHLRDKGIPTLGICYGMHHLVHFFGGAVGKGRREYGIATITTTDDPLFFDMDRREQAWMSHGDSVERLPDGFSIIATSHDVPAAIRHDRLPFFALQFHPEVNHTPHGLKVLDNFLTIAGIDRDWTMEDFIEQTQRRIADVIGKEKAIIALSGGVDSSVAAMLAANVLGKRLHAIFVDHGLLRKHERAFVEKTFGDSLNLIVIDAKDRFFSKLEGIADPEEKRKIIGNEFIKVFEEEAKKVGATYLVQGTIYPDVIESGSTNNADTIKSHHNVGGLPETLDFSGLVEPLRELYKDEVRVVGAKLGLPDSVVNQHPCPGPGLAVRITGPVTDDNIRIVREASAILDDELRSAGWYQQVWQSFAVLFEDRIVGVVGDQRRFGRVVGLRVVQSVDAMTANFVKLPWDLLERISTRITNEIEDVVSVSYFISHKPPQTIEPC
ncbi:glutamine-hydrolyzing GMP synthase [archaeon]|nr:MAG: glutamine-hydrolyzing GMP synthase [archaeon]